MCESVQYTRNCQCGTYSYLYYSKIRKGETVQFYDGFYEEEKALSGPFVNEISKNSYHLVDWPFKEKKIPTKHNCLETFTMEQVLPCQIIGCKAFGQLEFWHRALSAYGSLSIGILAYRILSVPLLA